MILATVMLVLSMVGCPTYVIRDERAVRVDYMMLDRVAKESAKTIQATMQDYCACQNGHWATVSCENSAKTYLFLTTRLNWHLSMMLYNSGLTETRPGEVPEIPMPDTLCNGGLSQ